MIRILSTSCLAIAVLLAPMAKGSWLQEGTEIRNPYHGSEMLRCGQVVTPAGGAIEESSR